MANSRITSLSESLKDIVSISGSAQKALGDINSAVLKTGDGFGGLQKGIEDTTTGIRSLASGIDGMVRAVTGGSFSTMTTMFGSLKTVVDQLNQTFIDTVRIGDQMTAVNRDITASNFALGAQFGKSLEEAEKFTDFMLKTAPELADSAWGYQSLSGSASDSMSAIGSSSLKMVEILSQARISFDRMTESVEAGTKTTDLYHIATLQAQSVGLGMSEYASLLSDAILKQGMSMQQAIESISLYGDISERTGLTVTKVAESLNGLGLSFRKMGLDVNFGQSYLEGFVKTLENTGIGIENAVDLAQSFGGAVAGLGTNYSSAYLTAQRGGLDMGSGGALGPAIQLQARLMEKGGNQAELGKEVGLAIKDTLTSFTGGEIVTVQQAASSKDPRMEQTFYTQVELLKSLYGLQDQDAIRSLELLDQLQTAITSGNDELVASVGKDLEEVTKMRESSMSNEEKLNAIMTSQFAELATHTKLLGIIAASVIKEGFVDNATGGLQSAVTELGQGLDSLDGQFSDIITRHRTEGVSMIEAITGETGDATAMAAALSSRPASTSMASGYGDDLLKFLQKGELKIQYPALDETLKQLSTAISDLANRKSPIGSIKLPPGTISSVG